MNNIDPGAAEKASVPALVKGFAILDLVAREPGLTFSGIRARLGMPKSSSHHLISTLCRLGALKMQPDGGYVLGLRLSELGALAADQRYLEREALPCLRRLAREVQLTCHLGVLEGHEAVYLSKIECEQAIRINSWVGKRFPLHCSALGKVLLAWQPPAELEALLADIEWEPRTPATLPDAAALRAHLVLVRQRGWATDDEENVANIRCVAAPIRDANGRVVAAISAVGTVLQIGPERFEPLAERLCCVANEISEVSFRK